MPTAPGAQRVLIYCLMVVLLVGVLAFLRSAQNQDTSTDQEVDATPQTAVTPSTSTTPSAKTAQLEDAAQGKAVASECQKRVAELRQFMDAMPTNLRSIKGLEADKLGSEVTRHEGLCRSYLSTCSSEPSDQIGAVEFMYAKHLQALKLRRQMDLLKGNPPNGRAILKGWLASYMGEVERLSASAFEKLPKDHPWRPDALQLAGQAASAASRPEQAVEYFTKWLKLYPDNPLADNVQLAAAKGLLDMGAYEKSLQVTLQGLEKYPSSDVLPTYAELVWKNYHSLGDFEGMTECVQDIEKLCLRKLREPGLSEGARAGYERLIDYNGFRKGYVLFALGDFGAARQAFQEHIDMLDKKEKEGGGLKPESNVYRMRSTDCLNVVDLLAGLPAPIDFDLGQGWITRKHVRVAESSGKLIALVFRGVDNARSSTFLGPLSHFCANQPDIEMLTISFLRGPNSLKEVRDSLTAELGTLEYEGAAGFDPDADKKQIFRKYHANVGSATFVILNRRGELVWFMQDPRGQDVQFAAELLKRVAKR